MRVALVSTKTDECINAIQAHGILGLYHFFVDALKRHPKMDVDYYLHLGNRLDVRDIVKNHDVILLPRINAACACALKGITDYDIPVLTEAGDPHAVYLCDILRLRRKLKVDHTFSIYSKSVFYRYYPKHFKYTVIPFGLESRLFKNIRPWEERIDDYIGISGVLNPHPYVKYLYRRYIKKEWVGDMRVHYKLRTACSKLPYVLHTRDIWKDQVTDELPEVLNSFQTVIAATTVSNTMKYTETPAAGCLAFMEVTDLNGAAVLGYEDGKTAVFINESNYRERFREYLDNVDDPKWRKIAEAGRKYTMENLTNDDATEKLHDLMRKLVGEL